MYKILPAATLFLALLCFVPAVSRSILFSNVETPMMGSKIGSLPTNPRRHNNKFVHKAVKALLPFLTKEEPSAIKIEYQFKAVKKLEETNKVEENATTNVTDSNFDAYDEYGHMRFGR